MKKTMKILGVLLAVIIILLVLAVVLVNRYLQSPEFKEFALGAARDALGSNVKIDDMNISLFSGVALTGVVVANPQGFPGDLLTADAFVLRYRLLPLLRRRVEIEEISLRKPAIKLVRGDAGKWNYESLVAKAGQAATSNAPASTAPAPTVKRGHFEISLSKVTLDNGNIVMLTQTNKELLDLQGINLNTSVGFADDKLTGDGKAGIDAINLSDSLFIHQLAALVKLTGDSIELDSLNGQLADGRILGNVSVRVLGDLKYAVQLQVKDADVDKLLQDAKTKRVMNGKLQATVTLEGTGGLPTIAGSGNAEIVGGTLTGIPLLNKLALILQVPELKEVTFDECRLEFSITNNVLETPVIRLISKTVQIIGKGAVTLENNQLNHDMTLALAPNVLANVPSQIRGIFSQRADGFLTIDFHVDGPYDSPKTDIEKRLLKGAAQQLLQEGLKQIFK